MKRLVLIVILLILSIDLKSQETSFDWNLILKIDGDTKVNGFLSMNIHHKKDGESITYKADYVPGSLKIEGYCQDKFDEGNWFLTFRYITYYANGEYFERDYEIKFHQAWLNYEYVIFDIYNMDNEKNKTRFPSQIDKEYIYGYNIPGTIFSWDEN